MKNTLRAARSIALALLPVAALALAAPWLRIGILPALALGFLVAAATLVAGASGVTAHARTLREIAPILVAGLVSAAAGLLVARAGRGGVITEVLSGLIASGAVLAVGGALGVGVGGRIAHPGHLLAVALASSAADIWSVHAPEGVTHAIVAARDVSLQRLVTLSAAVAPDRSPEPAIGVGDVIFAALYLAACTPHGLSRRRMTFAVAVGLLLAGAATFALKRPMPALPFLGAMVVLFEPRARSVPSQDRVATAVAGALLVAAVLRVARLG
ncbi:MAG: hypothetical protein WCJ30_00545 [Deltaproteobacteria bacterium]